MARRRKPVIPPADLFDAIPRTVAQARRVAKTIGAPLTPARYRSIEAANVYWAERARRRGRPMRPYALREGVVARIRVVRDLVSTGAAPVEVIAVSRSFGVSPDLWLDGPDADDWLDDHDISRHDVFVTWWDSPPGAGTI